MMWKKVREKLGRRMNMIKKILYEIFKGKNILNFFLFRRCNKLVSFPQNIKL